MTIVEFLLARIAEDESAARSLPPAVAASAAAYERIHFARWVPARVLAECQAKRAIVEDVASGHFDRDYDEAVKYLAAVYADHPAYRQEWRPT